MSWDFRYRESITNSKNLSQIKQYIQNNMKEVPKGMFYIDGEPELVTFVRKKILSEFADLEFVEEGHQYFLNGQRIEHSISGIAERFIQYPFEKEKAAINYAAKHGNTPQYWINQWNEITMKAATLGTKTHEFGESLGYLLAGHPEFIRDSIRPQYVQETNSLSPMHPKEEAVVKFFADMPTSMHLVINEARVYSGKNPDATKNMKELICGTFDMLYFYDGDGDENKAGFIILDYKTNKALTNDYYRKFHMSLLYPFSDMIQEELSLYTIQLSLYAMMLEDIGIPVIDRQIVWLNNNGQYQLFHVDDVSEKLRTVL